MFLLLVLIATVRFKLTDSTKQISSEEVDTRAKLTSRPEWLAILLRIMKFLISNIGQLIRYPETVFMDLLRNVIYKNNAAFNCIIEKGSFPSTLTGHTVLYSPTCLHFPSRSVTKIYV